MTFATPSTALLQAWAAVPPHARALLELFLDAPAVVVEDLGASMVRLGGAVVTMRSRRRTWSSGRLSWSARFCPGGPQHAEVQLRPRARPPGHSGQARLAVSMTLASTIALVTGPS